MAKLPTFVDVERELLSLNTTESAAYAHGLLCALFCAKSDITLIEWLSEVTDEEAKSIDIQSTQSLLQSLFLSTKQQLNDPEMGFELLIADDEILSDQVVSLKQWSHGFLSGLGLTKTKTDNCDALEVMKIISVAASSESENIVDTEENRQDFFEIIEFIRIGVLFLQETLTSRHKDIGERDKTNNRTLQ